MVYGIVAGYCSQTDVGDSFGGGVRRLTGSQWSDITYNLFDPIEDYIPSLFDLSYINSVLYAVVYAYAAGTPSALLRLEGTTWVTVATSVDRWNAIFCWRSHPYLHGSSKVSGGWKLWKMDTGLPVPFVEDSTLIMPLSNSRRTAVAPYGDELLISNLEFDSWGRFDPTNNTFYEADNFSGSCVFALGIDNHGIVWSGDYGQMYFHSVDGGRSYLPNTLVLPPDAELGVLSEVWEFYHWASRFVSVGCNPCTVATRNTAAPSPVSGAWDVNVRLADFFPELETNTNGEGFQCCEMLTLGRLLIGFGGEPYYYGESPSGATVFQYDALDGTLTDVGGGLDWGSGVHILTSPRRCHFLGPIPGAIDQTGTRPDPVLDARPRGAVRP